MADIKWRVIDQDFANFELKNVQQKLAGGDDESGDNYLCGNCGYILAEKISRNAKDVVKVSSVRCPQCKKVLAVEWYSAVPP